ncbi:platelet glycoprotein IX [Cyanistes caeruleus]|uniref:platelet glycoprotein IX n=1 Tax=Cyanistes caeruleus TaxID=156563 RepID=UPI000CDAA39A|nr:platelet glycoprotein IX [Cyanistes caeruleus]
MELLAVLGCALLFPMVVGEDCPSLCSCWSLGEAWGMHVDCSSRGLRSLPALPRLTRSLHLHNNSLASIPAGALDSLGHLQELQVWDNPWHCDCHILYLKLWLQDFSAPALARLRCASPAHLRMKSLGQLTGNDLGVCTRLLPTKSLQFFWRDLILIAGVIITLILVARALKISKKLICQLTLGRRHWRRNIPKTHKIQLCEFKTHHHLLVSQWAW